MYSAAAISCDVRQAFARAHACVCARTHTQTLARRNAGAQERRRAGAQAHRSAGAQERRRAGAQAHTPGQWVVRRSALRARGEGSSSVWRAAVTSFWMRSRTILYFPICTSGSRQPISAQTAGRVTAGQAGTTRRRAHRKAVPFGQREFVNVVVEELKHTRAVPRPRGATGRIPGPLHRMVDARGSTRRGKRPPRACQAPIERQVLIKRRHEQKGRSGRRQDEQRQQRRHGYGPPRQHASNSSSHGAPHGCRAPRPM